MPTRFIQRRAALAPNDTSRGNANAIFIDSDDDQLKFTTGSSGTTTVDVVTESQTQTLTNKTLTAPTITAPVISGAATVAAGATLAQGVIHSDTVVLASSETYNADATPGLITGFSWTVVAAGVYEFDVDLSTTMTINGGLTVAFKLTTATLTSIRYTTYAATASDNTTAVSTYGTTTTDLTEPFDSKTAAYTTVRLRGVLVVNAGGTFAWHACQETSAAGGDATIILLNSTARLTRVA